MSTIPFSSKAEAFNPAEAQKVLAANYEKAEKIVNDPDQLELLLQRCEKKLKGLPVLKDTLSYIPSMILLVRSYIRHEYTNIPIGTIIAIVGAIIYFVSPIDIIPDVIPGIGHLDDAAVIGICLKLVSTDIDEYKKWRKKNGKDLDV